jgi:hypothetical protein
MGHGRDNAYVLGHFQERDPKKKTKTFSFHPLLNGSFEGPMSRVRASPKKKIKRKGSSASILYFYSSKDFYVEELK